MNSNKTNKERALALPDNNIGQQRYELFKSVLSRINQSCQDGYYLEAITLIESLISDRLESYLSFVLGDNIGFQNLGTLINHFESKKNQEKIDNELKEVVLNNVNDWRKKRNKVLHEMAKIDFNNQLTWEQKCQDLNEIAENGLNVFRKIDKRLANLRKNESQP